MNAEEVKLHLENTLPDCLIQVENQGNHFNVVAVGDLFDGKRAVQRQPDVRSITRRVGTCLETYMRIL